MEGKMRKEHFLQSVGPLLVVLLIFFSVVNGVLANGEVSETQYSTSLSEATGIVRIIVAVFGGIIGVLGIVVAFRNVGGTADVSMSVSEHRKLSLKRVSQGVVITLIGAAILTGALYLLPEKRTERQIKGKEITIERESGKERMQTAD
jgi:glycerol uptake facilitator-like aquaporin